MRRLLTLLAVLIAPSLAAPSLARAQAGVQWTRERDATLVSKDVGSERWSITYRLSDGRTTGNVFRADGGPPAFLDCQRTAVDDVNATFDCFGADACAQAPCPGSQYSLIMSGIVLPVAFFFPPGDTPSSGSPTLDNLIGTWRITINPGNDPTTVDYRFDHLEQGDGGPYAVGEAQGSGNRIIAFGSGDGGFVMTEEGTVHCERYEFNFANVDRLEGSHFQVLFLPLVGDCDQNSTDVDRNPFIADRIG